jgi:hypothetical protein
VKYHSTAELRRAADQRSPDRNELAFLLRDVQHAMIPGLYYVGRYWADRAICPLIDAGCALTLRDCRECHYTESNGSRVRTIRTRPDTLSAILSTASSGGRKGRFL